MTGDAPKARPRFPWLPLAALAIGLGGLASQGHWEPLWFAGGMVIGFAALIYAAAPVLIRRRYWVAARPEVRPVDPDSAPPAFAEAERATAEALGRLWFDGRGTFELVQPNAFADGWTAVFEDPASRTVARLIGGFGKSRSPRVELILVFSDRFADGTEVQTTNYASPPLIPIPPGRKGFAFPGVGDPGRLLALHRQAVAHSGEFSARVATIEGDAGAYLAGVIADETAHQVRIGYLGPGDARGRHRPTLKGACLMTWRRLWPFGAIGRAWRRARAARFLRKWQAEGPA